MTMMMMMIITIILTPRSSDVVEKLTVVQAFYVHVTVHRNRFHFK